MPKYGSFSGPYFPVFGQNTEIYGVDLGILSEYRKIRTRKNSVFTPWGPENKDQKKLRIYSANTFHAVFGSLAIEMQELAPILDSVVETLRINKYTGSHIQEE